MKGIIMPALAYAIQLLSMLPSLIGAGQGVMSLITQGQTALAGMVSENRDPTPSEWAALDAIRDTLHAKVQAP
jgi:hypothetical protein